MLQTKKKQLVIKKYQTHEGDTGSSEVQIALLTVEIEELISHLKHHPKDHSSRRGLLRKVSSRRRLMRFLKKENAVSYDELVKKLKIKQPKVLVKPGVNPAISDDEEVEEELMEKVGDDTDKE